MQMTDRGDGVRLAWTKSAGREPTVVFLPGLGSDMSGDKASALAVWLAGRGNAYLRLDYSGHGRSDGTMAEGTIGRWRDDALTIMDQQGGNRMLLVGSSMGGWIALLAAMLRPQQVVGVVTVAMAADFTERSMWNQFSAEQRRKLMREGWIEMQTSFADRLVITRDFIEDGRRNLLLEGPIEVRCPARLLHGQRDADVSWQVSVDAAGLLQSDDVRVVLTKDGDHALSRAQDIEVLVVSIEDLLRRHDGR